MARIRAMSLLAVVCCLLVTSEWYVTMTSSAFLDSFSSSEFPIATRTSPEAWREVLRLATVLSQPPKHDSSLYPSSLERSILHPPFQGIKRNSGYIDAILGMPDLMKQGRKK